MNAQNLTQVAYDAIRNRVFTKDDIINAYLRAGIAVEYVDHKAQLFIDQAVADGRIKPLANNAGKFTRRV